MAENRLATTSFLGFGRCKEKNLAERWNWSIKISEAEKFSANLLCRELLLTDFVEQDALVNGRNNIFQIKTDGRQTRA